MRFAIKLLVVLAALGAGGYGAWYKFWRKPAPLAVDDVKRFIPDEKAVIERGNLKKIVNATGRVLPNQDIRLKCKASGQIIEMPFNISDRVKKGDLLVTLDPTDEERNTRKAKVALEVSQNKLEAAKIQYNVSRQTLDTERSKVDSEIASWEVKTNDLETSLNRAKQLFSKDLVSREDLDKADVAFRQAELSLQQARLKLKDLKTSELSLLLKQNDIEVAKAQVETDELKLLDAQQRLTDTKVFAPIDGVVSNLLARVGQIVSSGTSSTTSGTDLLDLTDLSRIFTEVNVDESDVADIREGMPAIITTDAGGERKYDGKVMYIAPKGSRSRGVVNFVVRIQIMQKESPALRPEMSTDVDIILNQRSNVLLVPLTAVRSEGGKYFVQVLPPEAATPDAAAPATPTTPAAHPKQGGTSAAAGSAHTEPSSLADRSEKREVKLGLSDKDRAEVLSGLKEGETVLISLSVEESRWISKVLEKDNMAKQGGAKPAKKR